MSPDSNEEKYLSLLKRVLILEDQQKDIIRKLSSTCNLNDGTPAVHSDVSHTCANERGKIELMTRNGSSYSAQLIADHEAVYIPSLIVPYQPTYDTDNTHVVWVNQYTGKLCYGHHV